MRHKSNHEMVPTSPKGIHGFIGPPKIFEEMEKFFQGAPGFDKDFPSMGRLMEKDFFPDMGKLMKDPKDMFGGMHSMFDHMSKMRTPALTRTVQVSFVFCLLFFKWSGRVKLWYPAPWVGNTNVPHSAERKGELACVSRFLTYVMASSRMGDHGRTHKGQANEICARGVRIFCRCMRPPKS